jgi:hypothetical protein
MPAIGLRAALSLKRDPRLARASITCLATHLERGGISSLDLKFALASLAISHGIRLDPILDEAQGGGEEADEARKRWDSGRALLKPCAAASNQPVSDGSPTKTCTTPLKLGLSVLVDTSNLPRTLAQLRPMPPVRAFDRPALPEVLREGAAAVKASSAARLEMPVPSKAVRWAPEAANRVIEYEKANPAEAWGDAPMDSRRNNDLLNALRTPGMTFFESVRALDRSEGGEGLDVLPHGYKESQLTWGQLMTADRGGSQRGATGKS